MRADRLLNAADPGHGLMNDRGGSGCAVSPPPCAAETRSGAEFLITIKADVVDAHFARFNPTHYLLKVRVFDLQSVTDH